MRYHSDGANPIQQRRISARHAMRVDLVWDTGQSSRWRRPRTMPATSIDLSLSGIAFESEAHPDVQRGSAVNFTVQGVTSRGVVRYERPSSHAGRHRYGVEFSDPKMVMLASAIISNLEERPGAVADAMNPVEGGPTSEEPFVNWH